MLEVRVEDGVSLEKKTMEAFIQCEDIILVG